MDGIAVSIHVIALLLMLFLAVSTGVWVDMYKQMGSARLPALTILVFSATWRFGVPLLGAIGLVITLVRRPHPLVGLGIALASLLVAIVWAVALYQPIWSLAGNIR